MHKTDCDAVCCQRGGAVLTYRFTVRSAAGTEIIRHALEKIVKCNRTNRQQYEATAHPARLTTQTAVGQ